MRYLVSFVWENNWHQWVPIIGRMQKQHSSGVLARTVRNAKAAFFRRVGKNCKKYKKQQE
ncbi:MAG TPA: hypothetical protein DCS73_07615 [Roseburia sp.]|nr:hypothetical protein [Roseburia sp.]